MSRERRFLVPDLDSERVTLSPEDAHHAVHVLRLAEGASVALFDGKGKAHAGVVSRIEGDDVEISIGEALATAESPLQLSLAVTVPKGDEMTNIVRRLTELGVHRVLPITSERSESGRERRQRWRRVAIEAAKQCGRAMVPEIDALATFEQTFLSATPPLLLAHPGAAALDANALAHRRAVTAFIGPEGGWSESELAAAAEREATICALGPRTLRVETAAIAVTAMVQWLAGDLGLS